MDYIDVTDNDEMSSSSSCSLSLPQCVICNQSSHGIHFGVSTCRACAAFFRRTVVLDRKYTCRRLNSDCDITLDVRYLCRYCRYQKCLEVGMTPDNVQWNRDRMSSSIRNNDRKEKIKIKKEKLLIKEEKILSQETEDSSEIKEDHPNSSQEIGSVKPPPPQQISRLLASFLDLARNIEILFLPTRAIEVVSPFHLTALQRMVIATERYRGELPQNPKIVDSVDFSVMTQDWFIWLEKTAFWLMHCEEFARLPTDQKLLIFRSTWSSFLRLEKVATSLLIFGEEVITKRLSICANFVVGPNTRLDMGDLSNWSPEEFKKLIHNQDMTSRASFSFMRPQMDHLFEGLARPMLSIGPEPMEFIYLLCLTVWNVDGRGASKDTVLVADQYRERISAELHDYYVHSKSLPNYAHRFIQLHGIIQNNEKIQQERNDLWTMLRVFDAFNFEFPDLGVFDPSRM